MLTKHYSHLLVLLLVSSCLGMGRAGGDVHTKRCSPTTTTLAEGLQVWRKPGRIQGGAACATCHSPDGIELAYYRFDDQNLLRRARPHLIEGDAQILVRYLHLLRRKFHFDKPLDPLLNSPLQPGNKVLGGRTAGEGDEIFGKELAIRLPTLFGAPVRTLSTAKTAERELLALDPRTLPISFRLNRLSEDFAHGNEHSTIAQWLPEMPPQIPADQLPGWYELEDRYLQQPQGTALRDLITRHSLLIDTNRQLAVPALSTLKFRALLVLQDRIRHHMLVPKAVVADDVRGPGTSNLLWAVGDLARQFVGRPVEELGLDSDTQAKKLAGPNIKAQFSSLRLSWLYAGWLSDQGLFKTGLEDKTRLGLWLANSLSEDGPYPILNAYTVARRQAVISTDPGSWDGPLTSKRLIWDFAALRVGHRDSVEIPNESSHRRLYTKFLCNCYRTSLFLLKEDLESSHRVWIKLNSLSSVVDMIAFIEKNEPETKQIDESLKSELDKLIDQATDRYTR